MKKRIAILGGVRTPFAKAGGGLSGHSAHDLGAFALKAAIDRSHVPVDRIDEVVVGNVAQPGDAANMARVCALKAGFPRSTPAMTVNRNCASGLEALATASERILAGRSEIVAVAGAESMSNIPLLFGDRMTALFGKLLRSKTLSQRLKVWAGFRPSFLSPVVGVQQGLTDPVSGLNMGQTAEILAREFSLSRAMQDAYALESHRKAVAARERLAEEIVAIPAPPAWDRMVSRDEGPREDASLAGLAKLRPYFDPLAGTVTTGNACPITDGAGAMVVCSEEKAREMGIEPLGYLVEWAWAGLDPSRMGLGPVYAMHRLLERTGGSVSDFDLVELNEAFASQTLACLAALDSDDFARRELGRSARLGAIDPAKLNVNGGAIALGHPVGATGARLVVTILHELRRRGLRRGLATLCIGGGQGAAFSLEVS